MKVEYFDALAIRKKPTVDQIEIKVRHMDTHEWENLITFIGSSDKVELDTEKVILAVGHNNDYYV